MNQARLKDVPFSCKLKRKELELIAQHADEVDVRGGKVFGEMALLEQRQVPAG